ncbi:conserved hypothetical protein [Ricinus communis]|uniref:Protein MIZU-KUSSEI 1 n=1 Tax=Ricinus communis TaxID=3988 RepID=B9SVG4_RICCO|nr:conserved hypothetical protein [Ricinus communis]
MANPTPPLSPRPHSSPPSSPSMASSSPRSLSPPRPAISLQQPTHKKGPSKSAKLFRRFRAVFRSFPIITPTCKIPVSLHGSRLHDGHIHGKLLQDMGMGLVRVALECEKKPHEKTKIIDEPIWTMYCNGRKTGYGVKRAPTDEDLVVMQILHVISMGAGVIPDDGTEQPDGELTYMRAHFERVIGSKDSETYYMMNPDGNSGPELSIFFVRI